MTDRSHGECLAASIRVGLAYNRPAREAEYAAVADSLGARNGDGGDDDGDDHDDPAAGADDLLAECDRLREAIGLPGSFAAVGCDRSDTDQVVENTLIQERRLATNPRKVSEADLREAVLAGFE
jgi:alcohol dehydrogenase class IV